MIISSATLKDILQLRHELHTYPEVSNYEQNTAQRILKFIKRYHPSRIIENLGGHGVAAIYTYAEDGPTIVIRCELDALPILEKNNFEYYSAHTGVSHKCGHDGHMAIVAGLAPWLEAQKFRRGNVVLLFQPAEETGEGAKRIINDPRFQSLQPDRIYALHNIPGSPMHSIILIDKGFSAEVISFVLRLHGKECHASQPENGTNPAKAIAALVDGFQKLEIADPTNEDFALLTPVHISLGQKAYGISPGDGELHYTIRTWHPAYMDQLQKMIKDHIDTTTSAHNLTYTLNWLEYFPASLNDANCTTSIQRVAQKLNLSTIQRSLPYRFGEDFGWYSKTYASAMFGLGAGENTPALHHSDYDFPDTLIETGIRMFTQLITDLLDD